MPPLFEIPETPLPLLPAACHVIHIKPAGKNPATQKQENKRTYYYY
jgi:hypothetical protein